MKLTITRRLTATHAALTAVILVPAISWLHVLASRDLESSGEAAVRSEAIHLAHHLVRQLDEDILVDFRGGPASLGEMHWDSPHWAILRGSDRVVHAAGAFIDDIPPAEWAKDLPVAARSGSWFRVASTHLVQDIGPTLGDLPAAARERAVAECPGGVFLNVKLEISGDSNVIALKFLDGGRILEVQVTEDGKVIRKRPEELPRSLSSDLLRSLAPQVKDLLDLRWAARDGQLLAIIDGLRADGSMERLCVNRLGEEFRIDSTGNVEGILPGSRLHVITAIDVADEVRKKEAAMRSFTIAGALLWIASIAMGWYVTRRALSPVGEIVKTCRGIVPGKVGERLPVGKADDELSRMAATINGMLDRIEGAYARERQFTGDASHELRAPLTKVIADIDLAVSQDRSSGEYREALLRVRGYAEDMKRLVESLLLLARLDNGLLERSDFDLGELAVETVHRFPEKEARRISVDLRGDDSPIKVHAERRLLGVLIHNLLDNALRYSPASKPVILRIERNGTHAIGEVEDAGSGIDPSQAPGLFDRLRRADEARSREAGGFGLGLSIVKTIADAHGMEIELLRGNPGTIARFSIPLGATRNVD